MTEASEVGAIRDVESAERLLASSSLTPSVDLARAVRNVAAEHLLADPSVCDRISSRLVDILTADDATAEALAVGWRCRAEAHLYCGRPLDARATYERAVREAERARAHGELGQILVGLVITLNTLGESDEAGRQAARAEHWLERADDRTYLGKLYLAQGNAHYESERFADALRTYRLAHAVLEAEGTTGPTWAILLMNLGVASTNVGKLADASRYLREAEEHARDHDLDLLRAHARFNRAYLERLTGDYRSALSLFESARAAFVRHDTGALPASVDRAMAEIYIDLAMPADALALARRARITYDEQGMAFDARLAELDEAVVLLDTGRAGEALERLGQLDGAFRARRMPARQAVVLFHTARAHLEQDSPRRARELASKARRSFLARGMPEWASRCARLVARAYAAESNGRAAERTLSHAMRHHRRLPVRERLALAAHAGQLSLQRGRRRDARVRLRRARDLLEAQRRLIPGVELRARALAEHASVHRGLVDLEVTSRSPSFEKLLGLVETGRARAFGERAALGAVPRDEKLSSIRSRLGQLSAQLETAQLEGAAEDTDAMQREIRALESKVIREERRRQSSERETPEQLGGASLSAISASLGSGESLVTYFATEQRVIALVVTKRRDGELIHAHRVLDAGVTEIDALVERISFQLESMALAARRASDNLAFRRRTADTLLGQLYAALLRPIADLLVDAGRLVIAPHARLHQVPFEALHDGTAYVGERFTVTRVASAEYFVRASRLRARRSGSLVVAGVTSGLASVGKEIDAISSALEEASPRVLIDPTTDDLLTSLEDARLVHISTHGTFREDNPYFSRLTTADGAVFLGDIIERRSRADLVVLSACQAGRSFTGQGDDLAGLAHGFLAAGARCLVASQWRVHDEATAALMDAFYRHYAGEAAGDAARALAMAGQETRRTWDHPFYWAAFSVHGR